METTMTHFDETTWIKMATKAYKAREQRKYWEQKEQESFDFLKKLSNGTTQSAGAFIFKRIVEQGRVNYSDIPQLKDINLDMYRGKQIEVWKLEVKLLD